MRAAAPGVAAREAGGTDAEAVGFGARGSDDAPAMLIDPARLGLFLVATVALLVVPGPAVVYIVTRSATQGWRAGLVSVAGIGTGNAVHATAGTLGLAALLASSPLAFAAVKWLGAAYLVGLGVTKLRRGPPAQETASTRPPAAAGALYGQGFLVAVLNPKTALFFLAFLPQFVDPARGAAWAQLLLLGGLFVGLGILSDSLYALLAGAVGAWLGRHPGVAGRERFVSAAIYVGLGVLAAVGS